jgi:hypothetical protein
MATVVVMGTAPTTTTTMKDPIRAGAEAPGRRRRRGRGSKAVVAVVAMTMAAETDGAGTTSLCLRICSTRGRDTVGGETRKEGVD